LHAYKEESFDNHGCETVVIGYDQSEQLDIKPAEYFVSVVKREKRACQACEEGGVMTAPLPVRIINKSLVSDHVVINTIISKYCDHVPLSGCTIIGSSSNLWF